MGRRVSLSIGAALMLLLGLARGAGGVALLLKGVSADPRIRATGPAAAGIGAALLVLGLVLVVSAVGVFRGRRPFWLLGVAGTVAFVIDGLINGTVLYGRPGAGGTTANLAAAAAILVFLLLSRAALQGGAAQAGGSPSD